MNKFMLVTLIICLSACSNPKEAHRALKAAGYSEVQTYGYAFWGCGQGDSYSTEFTAKNPAGIKVNGVVCSGILKGSTIRF